MILNGLTRILFQYLLKSNFHRPLSICVIACLILLDFTSGGKDLAKDSTTSIKTDIKLHSIKENADIVSYGEDCSLDGPYCDEALHLICDLEEETCVCDAPNGYMYFRDIPGEKWYKSGPGHVCVQPSFNPPKVVQEKVDNLKKLAETEPLKGVKLEEKTKIDLDIVGFGEDCSGEGPFCNQAQNLICDPVEETCICDFTSGYLHIDDIPGGREQYVTLVHDENGNQRAETQIVCVSRDEVSRRAEELLSLSFSNKIDLAPEQDKSSNVPINPSPKSHVVNEDISFNQLNTYNDLLSTAESEYDEEYLASREKRLEPFKLNQESNYDRTKVVVADLYIEELMKYGKGVWDLTFVSPLLKEFIKSSDEGWMAHKLMRQICGKVFDVDQDGLETPQEYIIAQLSPAIKSLKVPKVFQGLIRSLTEEECIRIEDLRELDHDPLTLEKDFQTLLDLNNNGCLSLKEFEQAMDSICELNWLNKALDGMGIIPSLARLDPSPEEMYIRGLMQNERMNANWELIDKNRDELISLEELQSDFVSQSHAAEDSVSEAETMMDIIDLDNDRQISKRELKIIISVPTFLTEEYQFEWLESLYELYETDEEEVEEYLKELLDHYKNYVKDLPDTEAITADESVARSIRIFIIFDKNSDGKMDEVEFKLLMEMIRKYVIHGIINDTIASMDTDGDMKLTVFEYIKFFRNSSDDFQTYVKNLLAIALSNDKFVELDDDEDYEEYTNEDEADDEGTDPSSSKVITRWAAKQNETILVYEFFTRLDIDSDGFVTRDDFYRHMSSYKLSRSESDSKAEFDALDKDKDGVLTETDSKEYAVPLDYETYKEHAFLSEEISAKNFVKQLDLINTNRDGIIKLIQLLVAHEDDMFLAWLESYLGERQSVMDKAGKKAFGEFDVNFDGLISEAEFKTKMKDMVIKSKETGILSNVIPDDVDVTIYFNSLDLNKDGYVSYNELHLLLLRNNRRINEL